MDDFSGSLSYAAELSARGLVVVMMKTTMMMLAMYASEHGGSGGVKVSDRGKEKKRKWTLLSGLSIPCLPCFRFPLSTTYIA